MKYLPIKIFNKNEKREILNKLKSQFGISKVPGILLKRGAERIFLFQGSFSKRQINQIEKARINLERVGMYFGKLQGEQIRLSIDAIHLLQKQISKNIFELNREQAEQWMSGNELNIETGKKEFLIMKYQKDFLGCGKASEKKISNFIPKNRRLKQKD